MKKETEKKDIPKKIANLSVKVADLNKAENIIQIKVTEKSTIADYFVLCTGNSTPHIKALAEHITRKIRNELKIRTKSVEGSPESEWILIDFGDVIIHILTPEKRDLYKLEDLWQKPINEEKITKLNKAHPNK